MIREFISPRDAVNLLNEMVKLDPAAMKLMVEARVECNKTLADHPTVQVGSKAPAIHSLCLESEQALVYTAEYRVGFLGVLNGLFGTQEGGKYDGWGAISAGFNVVCPNDHALPESLTTNDKCPTCKAALELGDLVSFMLVEDVT